MMKKALALIMTATLLVLAGLAYAGGSEKTRLVFWHSMSDEAGVLLEKYVEDFNATLGEELGIEVEAVFQGAYADATTKLNSILSSGQTDALPNVMQMDATGKISYASSGFAYTVDDLLADHPDIDLSNMLDAAMANWNYAGVQLGMPFATATTVLYYNKTLLDAAGLEAPQTLADIAALKDALPEVAPNGAPLVIYASVPNTPTLANWLGQLGSYVVDKQNGTEGSATKLACIENGALATFLGEWRALFASGALQNNAGSADAFIAGQQLLMTGSSSNITSNLEKIGGSFEMGVAPYPRVNAEAASGATLAGSCLVMFNKGGAVNAASWALVQYLTSAAVQADFAKGTGYIPANGDALETETYRQLLASNPAYSVGINQLKSMPASMRAVTIGPSADFYYAIQNCVAEMLDEGLSVEETVELMEDELGGLLEQYAKANP